MYFSSIGFFSINLIKNSINNTNKNLSSWSLLNGIFIIFFKSSVSIIYICYNLSLYDKNKNSKVDYYSSIENPFLSLINVLVISDDILIYLS